MTAGGPPQRLRKGPAPAPRPDEETWEKEANDVARRGAKTPGDLRHRLGSRLGYDFSAVRLRPDDRGLPPGVGAETSGDTVRIAPGHFRPDLPLGRALLAHELAHVAQQGAAPRTGGAGGFARRESSIADPGGPGLSPAPRGMRQRTVGCASPTTQTSKPSAPTTQTPEGYSPPDPDNASSYSRDFDHIVQFSFLIDGSGVIHARIESTRELSAVTGQVPGP